MARTATASEIAAFLGQPLQGEDGPVLRPAPLEGCGPGDLVWVKGYTPDRVRLIERGRAALTVCDHETASHLTVPHVACDRPRLAFIRAVAAFFGHEEPVEIHRTALIDPTATLGACVSIGAYTRIGPDVVVGDECRIGSGVSIHRGVRLGKRCRVKDNSVIGAPGFGFERDEEGIPVHFPHFGGVVLEDDVWVGSCSTIERAALGETLLCRDVKVDDLVQVGHNVIVGRATMIMANSVMCGGVVIGERCWIAPNSVVKEKVRVGDDVKIGLGAVVLADVAPGSVVAGVPARPLGRPRPDPAA